MNTRPHVALNAQLLSREASYRSAGIHGYLFNTLAHLPDAAPDLRFTLLLGMGQPPRPADYAIRQARLNTTHPLWRILWEQAAMPLDLAALRPALLHGMAFVNPALWPGPCVLTIYDLSFMRYPERLSRARRAYLSGAVRLSASRARRIIAISESGRQEIHTLLGIPLDRIDVALPGVRPEFSPIPHGEVEAFRAAHKLPPRFILHVGTLEPRKNLDTLLKAYAQLPHRKEVKLILVGGAGWSSGPLLSLIDHLNLTNDVLLPGFVPSETLPLWYNAAEVMVYPSVYEGFGLPVLEAMACGLPVIASHTTSLPEAVGPDGVLVPALDVEAWMAALTALLEDPARRSTLSTRGRARAGLFTWFDTARCTAECYRRALG